MIAAKSPADIAIFVNARISSRRCPGKMVRPFAGSTLIDICLDRLESLDWHTKWFGAHEPELLERAEGRRTLRIHRRSRESAESHSDPHKIFEILRVIEQPVVMWINPCCPLITLDTLERAIDHYLATPADAMTSVKELKGWFFSSEGILLNDTGGGIDTVKTDPIYQGTHSFHFYRRKEMIEKGRPWPNTPGVPHLFEVPEGESHDIDTEEEFEIGEILYSRRRLGQQDLT